MVSGHLAKAIAILAGAATLFAAKGCIQPSPVPVPTSEVLHRALTQVILDPASTCEDLRDLFDLDNFQIVTNPAEAGLPFVESMVETPDGVPLRVWLVPAADSRGVVLLSSGSSGDMACYLFTTRILHDAGWSVAMYDYRGFGGSGGAPSLQGLAVDLETALDWTRAATGSETVTLMGISIGTVPTVSVAVSRPEAVNGVILDSPVMLGIHIRQLAFVLRENTQAFVDLVDLNLKSEEIISELAAPLLILVGGEDRIARPSVVQVLFDRAPEPKRLVIYPEIDHGRAPFDLEGQYTADLDGFLAELHP